MGVLQNYSTMAIQEDFENWKDNDYHREVAKLQLIDQTDYDTHHIFFDDQANEDDECIVDTRDVCTNEIVSYLQQINKYVIKVEPYRAIMEPDYFCQMIEMAEKNRDEEIQRI